MDKRQIPVINWEALATLNRPARPMMPPTDAPKENMWEKEAISYNRMIQLESETTRKILDLLPLNPDDTAIDVCCGPGRITMQVAGRVKEVTAMDSAHNMLELCKENCAKEGRNNVTFLERDSFTAEAGKDFEKFDVVISSRSGGPAHLDKIISFSKRLVVFQGFANSPSLPETFGKIFEGCSDAPKYSFFGWNRDRRLSYNIEYNRIYDLGYEPNIVIMPDQFTAVFDTKEAAYEYILPLGHVDEDKMDIFKANMDKCLTENADGTYTFLVETRASIIWFEINPHRFY